MRAAGLAWRDMSILPNPASCCARGCREPAPEITPKLAALREASDPDDMPDLFWAICESAMA